MFKFNLATKKRISKKRTRNTKGSAGKSLRATSKPETMKTLHSRLSTLEKKQDKILSVLSKLLKEEKKIEVEEEEEITLEKLQLKEQKTLDNEELKEIEELKKLEDLENEIRKQTKDSPLKRVTIRDMTKGIIGAFFGIVGHFSFAEGVDIGAHFDSVRSIFLLLTSFVIVIIFLYFAGFRKINDELLFKVLPVRALVIYFSAIITIPIVLLLYGKITFMTPFNEIIGIISAISVLAVIGAGTADLIGKNLEE